MSRKRKASRPLGRDASSKRRAAKATRSRSLLSSGERITLFIKRNKIVLRSCGIFLACLGLAVFAYSKFIESESFDTFLGFTARATGFIINLFGSNVQVNGTLVSSSDFSMRIVTLCTGIVPITIFLSAVLAYPCKIKGKAIGMVIGILALYSLNLVRLITTFYIGTFLPGFFDIARGLIWQSIMILVAIVLWLLWAEKLARVTSH